MSEKIVKATEDDYEEMKLLANHCFNHEVGIMEQRWNHIWNDYTDNFFLCKSEAGICGLLALVPMVLNWHGQSIATGGIHAVTTHPDFRKRGIMTRLLRHIEHEMKQRGYDISVLVGDRSRYGHFGWELAGTKVRSNFKGKYLEKLPDPLTKPVRIMPGDRNLLKSVAGLYSRISPVFRRTEEQLQLHLKRPGIEFWVIPGGGKSGEAACYIGVFDGIIYEYGGRAEDLPGLIKYFAYIHGFQTVDLVTPGYFGTVEEHLFNMAGETKILPLCMLKILNFGSLMKKLRPALEEKIARAARAVPCDFKVALRIEEDEETVFLLSAEGGIEIRLDSEENRQADKNQDFAGLNTLSLPARKMVRLLFGPFSEGIIPEAGLHSTAIRALSGILPLPIYFSNIDMV